MRGTVHRMMSKAFADLVRSWLPATDHSASWPSGFAGESSEVGRCSRSSAFEVAHPRRLRSSPSEGISASTYTSHGARFPASFGSLRCRFYVRLYVRVKIQTGVALRGLTAKFAGCILRSTRSFKERFMAATCLLQVAVALSKGTFILPQRSTDLRIINRSRSNISENAGQKQNNNYFVYFYAPLV